MIKVTINTNFVREDIIIDESTKIADVLEQYDVDYGRFAVMINGTTLMPGDFSKSFADMGITESCRLSSITKTDNA